MRSTPTRVFALLSLATVAAVAACSSDSATGPRSSVTTQQAYDVFTTVSQDSSRQASYGDLALSGRLIAALGAPVYDINLGVAGQSEAFHAMALALRSDSAGVPLDSSIVVVGWRGTQANEMFVMDVYSDSGVAGYPEQDFTYVRDGQVYYGSTGVSLSYTAASGSCTPATVSAGDFISFVQAASYGCSGAKFSGGFSGTLAGDIDNLSVSLSLAGLPGSRIGLHANQVTLNRVPARLGRLVF